MPNQLHLRSGDRIIVGTSIVVLDDEFVSSIEDGDKVLAIADTGAIKRIPKRVTEIVERAVADASAAFAQLASVDTRRISDFYDAAASFLADDAIFKEISLVNSADVEDARRRGRSTTRLHLSQQMREDMMSAFRMWRDSPTSPSSLIDVVHHEGWSVEQWRAPLGVIAFVFEGRPNVFADATGVLKSGNTVVFRIGSDALETARAIMRLVIVPALEKSGLPTDSVVLLDSREHAAGWQLFSDSRIALAVARGSGQAVAELGAIARQSGISASLHGTGGAWMFVGNSADESRLFDVVQHSLDRKVCNTLNTICIARKNAETHVPIVYRAAVAAAERRHTEPRIHAVNGSEKYLPQGTTIMVHRAEGVVKEEQVTRADVSDLSNEFEWEENPEFFIVLVDEVGEFIQLFNSFSPQFVVSAVSELDDDVKSIWEGCNAPFVGNGFTRWVDGQFALLRPELGLSNWEGGRLFARGGVLSGDSAFTIRLKVDQSNSQLHR